MRLRALVAAVIALGLVGSLAGAASAASIPVSYQPFRSVAHFGSYGDVGTALAGGDCSLAMAGDLIQIQAHAARLPAQPFRTRYVQLSPNNDGVATSDLFASWEATPIDGYTIGKPVQIGVNQASIEAAVHQYRGVMAVVNLPINPVIGTDLPGSQPNAESHARALTWTLSNTGANGDDTLMPHAITVVGYGPKYVYFVTWGEVQTATWSWWAKYAGQAWTARVVRA